MEETSDVPLTSRQRVVGYLARSLGNDLRFGSTAEQQTAALLDLVADAVEHGYEAEMVALVRAWRLEREVESDDC